MSESKSLSKLQRLLSMWDSDMTAAAQQLMQLSDEDSSNGNNSKKKTKAKMANNKGFVEQRDEITCTEILGEDDEISRPIKKRRSRLLENLYKETKPIKVSHGKTLWN